MIKRETESISRRFVRKFWFDNNKPSKSVTHILNWIDDSGYLNVNGRKAYRKLILNLND